MLFLWGLLLLPLSAKADTRELFVQLSCLPSMHTAFIRTYPIDNIYDPKDPKFRSLEESNGIYLLSSFYKKKEPTICTLTSPDGKKNYLISIRADHYHKPQATGMCGADEWGTLTVTINGKLQRNMTVGGGGVGCPSEIDKEEMKFSIDYQDDATIYHCRKYDIDYTPKEGFIPVKEDCEFIYPIKM